MLADNGGWLGITVMPEWFACEGVDAVLDRVQATGATAIATSPYVLEVAPDGSGGREPPIDAGAGRVRPLDRALYGRHELWVRTAPSLVHDVERYRGQRYQPSPASELTRRQEPVLDAVIEAASARGIAVYLQVMAASPPGYRVQFSAALPQDACLGPQGLPHPDRVDRNASLASAHVVRYTATLVAELAQRYPGVAGFRLDWPEYPPYDFQSALFDFNPAARERMQRHGLDPDRVVRSVLQWADTLRNDLAEATTADALEQVFSRGVWTEAFAPSGPYAALRRCKRESVLELLRAVRHALDGVPGPRRRLEAQAFPPPLQAFSGFPLEELEGVVDAVGIKLYTMHWPMICRFWARDLMPRSAQAAQDALAAALAGAFDFVDAPIDPARLRYPEPHEPHPAGVQAQSRKIATARKLAGNVPVIAFAHSYGPREDVRARLSIAAASGARLWVNRYGYLSDAKLADLAAIRERGG